MTEILDHTFTTASTEQFNEALETHRVIEVQEQIGELSKFYKPRSFGLNYKNLPSGSNQHEIQIFATRTADGKRIEEIFEIDNEYSYANKSSVVATIRVIMLSATDSYSVTLCGSEVDVRRITEQGSYCISGAETDSVLFDLSHRLVDAKSRHKNRSDEEKMFADNYARQKLAELMPLVAKAQKSTSLTE